MSGKANIGKDDLKALKEFFVYLAKTESRKGKKGKKDMRLDLGIMAGESSKNFLVDLTKLVERMERAAGLTPSKSPTGKAEPSDDADVSEDEENFAPKKTGRKKASSFEEEEEIEEGEQDENEEEELETKKASKKSQKFADDEEEESDEEEETQEDEDEAPAKKAKKAKKVTVDDVNDACKERVQRLIKSGRTGPDARKNVTKLLEKKFGSKSISEIDPKDYVKVIEALQS